MYAYLIDNIPSNHEIESQLTEKDSMADKRNVKVWLYVYACAMVVCMCMICMKGKGC